MEIAEEPQSVVEKLAPAAGAKTIDEAKTLIEQGFEYVRGIDGIKLFRKRK